MFKNNSKDHDGLPSEPVTREQMASVLLALVTDLNSGINKVDLYDNLAWKIFNIDYTPDEKRTEAKKAFFHFLFQSQELSTEDEDVYYEFTKQFPTLLNLIKE